MPELRDRSDVHSHIAADITRARDMLGRLGERDAYEPNYTGEKLHAALNACAEALGLLGYLPADVADWASAAASRGHETAAALEDRRRR
jgi:hypothetical protein